MKPIIGVSCNFRPHEDEKGSFILDRSYIDAIYKAGGIPQIIPILPHEEIDTLIQLYDGILISGGGGLLPKIKKMKTLPDLKAQNPTRYTFEYKMIEAALQKNIPMLGICRGHQMINDVCGGTIVNLETNKHDQENLSKEASHAINVKNGTKLFHAVLQENVAVNSFHNQVIDQPGHNLSVSAYSDDGWIEGIESSNDHFVIGVQFHPELMIQETEMLNLYSAFVNAARNFKFAKR